jgi:hypothetical protein
VKNFNKGFQEMIAKMDKEEAIAKNRAKRGMD